MASFVFTGDPRMHGKDHADECKIFGMTFPAGKPVDVADEAVAERLRRHNHFAEAGEAGSQQPRRGRPPKVEQPEA